MAVAAVLAVVALAVPAAQAAAQVVLAVVRVAPVVLAVVRVAPVERVVLAAQAARRVVPAAPQLVVPKARRHRLLPREADREDEPRRAGPS